MKKGSFSIKFKTLGIGILTYILCQIIIGLLFHFLPLIHCLYERFESFIYFYTFTSTTNPHNSLLIIDREGEDKSRDEYAKLITKLNSSGAKVIAFDVLFEDKSDSKPESNTALIEATKAAANRIIYAMEFFSREQIPSNKPATNIPHTYQIKIPFKPQEDNFIRDICDAKLPFKDLLNSVCCLGSVTASMDFANRDQQYFPLLIYYKNDECVYPSLPLLTVMKFKDIRTDSIIHWFDDTIELRAKSDTFRIPLDGRSQTLINFISESSFRGRIISMKAFLDSTKVDSVSFKDKIVLIGDSQEPTEKSPGPRGEPYPNLFIHASLISQILNNQCIKDGIFENFLSSFFLIIIGLIWLFWFVNRFKRIKSWHIHLFAILIFLIFSSISLVYRTKTYIILPYLVFAASYMMSRKYYLTKTSYLASEERAINEVFISYSHYDLPFVKKLKSALETQNIKIRIDIETLKFGDDILEYINKTVRETDFTISIVSKNSLISPWVVIESLETLIFEKVKGGKKFIPIYVDKSFLEDTFQGEIIEAIDHNLEVIMKETLKLIEKNVSTIYLDSKRAKLMELRNNIDKILKRLNESLTADFSSEEKFEVNIPKLIKLIKSS